MKANLSSSKPSAPAEVTPEQHLEMGIELHDAGSLQESTYHLRLAARAGHPTAMLLYALACRHGWGMKPNQVEGVSWLQRSVDSAQLEVAEDEDLVQRGDTTAVGPVERKTHKAQFALSVYELGVSYMNGWGVTQDRALGLRCFEVAGNWGDADALAEAGFCYAEGLGCKKDLKKAAKFYRAAEKKGMSMAGNSW
jgi:TPR repeat protein